MTGWFLTDGEPVPGAPSVVCFPHAGGDPRTYLAWQRELADATVRVVCPPGRAHRFGEPPPASLDELADDAAEAILRLPDGPVCLVGHSLGGLVAFEVARRLRDDDAAVSHLVVSGCAAPSLLPTEYIVWAAGLPWDEFVEATAKHEGLAREIVEDPELAKLLLPDLRADVRLYAAYRYRQADPLGVAVSLVNGADDWRVSGGVLHPWEREFTTAPAYHWREGGHFYFADRPAAVVDVLRESPRRAPAPDHVEVI